MSTSIQDTFFEECEELLGEIDEGLTSIDEGGLDSESVNAVFRAVHSIKGGAGAFGLDNLVGFAHTFETVLDVLRSNKLNLSAELTRVLFRASDHLSDLVSESRGGNPADPDTRSVILAELESFLDEDELGEEVQLSDFAPVTLDFDLPELGVQESNFVIRFKPHFSLYENGNEPLFLLQALFELGEAEVEIDASALPGIEELDPEDAYLAWNIRLRTTDAREAIEAIFEFVNGLCELVIQEEPVRTDAIPNFDVTAPPMVDVQEGVAKLPSVAPEPAKQNTSETRSFNPTLRVELDRVDRLINTVGELIINHSMLAQQVHNLDASDLKAVETELESFKALAREIQECVMSIRAQPVKPLFQRMARIVREASSTTGKQTRLVTDGEATEVDKTVIERLTDPLTHLLRNAVDHGIEEPETRQANGKPSEGEIRLSASHRSGSVYIEIKDDGAGLNRKKIKEIAISKALIPENAELSDAEIDNLLFLPGFSTAAEVSNLSGRGVGMDVVRNSVSALGGRINISSTPGQGTTIAIVLPLTMAVMDGMVISVAEQTMVVPIASIVETIRASENLIHSFGPNGKMLSVRGSFVPVCEVASVFGLRSRGQPAPSSVFLLIETELGERGALAVDAIHDQRQVVIKSLEGVCDDTAGIAAATILGDGKIAMILDPEKILTESPVNTRPI